MKPNRKFQPYKVHEKEVNKSSVIIDNYVMCHLSVKLYYMFDQILPQKYCILNTVYWKKTFCFTQLDLEHKVQDHRKYQKLMTYD